MKRAMTRLIAILLLLSPGWFPQAASSQELNFFCLRNLTERTEGYYTMVDREDRSVLLRTARILQVGSEFIDSENRRFRVAAIEDDTALAERIDENRPAAAMKADSSRNEPGLPVQAQGEQKPKVGIYHSHGAESYVPSDGTDSIDQGGGIIDVGETFSKSLEQKGVETEHETEPHVPHDAGAYMRSRSTAERLITEKDADLIIDVHRDAVPAENYKAVVNGEEVTQLLLVVGAENQNMANNEQLARDLKAIADERYPGLVKGILNAPGSYNQDLSPNSILVEVGSHENEKEDAQKAVEMFADVVNIYLNEEAAAPEDEAQQSGIALRSVLIVLAILAAALLAYLYISAGSWEEMKRKITFFFQREFADLGRGFRSKRDDDEDRG